MLSTSAIAFSGLFSFQGKHPFGELVTKLTGRYVEFETFPLYFAEYLRMNRHLGKGIRDKRYEFEDYLRYRARLAAHSATSSASALWLKRWPSCQSPVPAASARSSPLSPIGEDEDVQKGMTVLHAKSLPYANPLTGQAAIPHQIG